MKPMVNKGIMDDDIHLIRAEGSFSDQIWPNLFVPTFTIMSQGWGWHCMRGCDCLWNREELKLLCFLLHLKMYSCECAWRVVRMGIHVSWCAHGGQITTFGHQFFPSTMWVWGLNSGIRLGGEHLYLISHPSPIFHPSFLHNIMENMLNCHFSFFKY